MTNDLIWRVQIHSTSFNDNVLTGSYKQTFICHPFWLKGPILGSTYCVSFLRLQAGFTSTVLHRQLVILLSKHYTVGVSGNVMSGPGKRPRLLRPSEISELIFDTDSDETHMSSNISSVEGGSESVTGVQQPQQYCLSPRGCCWEWARWTDSASNPEMDTPLLTSEQWYTHIHEAPDERRTMKRHT